jgi:hypothetical protein
MEIKRPGPGFPGFDPLRESRETVQKKETDFANRISATPLSTGQTASASGLPGVVSEFRLADLKNPQRLEQVLRSSIDEMLNKDPRRLTSHQKLVIGDWMQNDPTIRRQIEKYLEKVLQ